MPIKLLTVSIDELSNWPASPPFSAWLHFDRNWSSDDEKVVANIISSGCRLLMITGNSSDEIEGNIDWIVPDVTQDIVLTTAADEIDEKSAFEFLSTDCPGVETSYCVIAVFANDVSDEMRLMVQIRKAIEMAEAR